MRAPVSATVVLKHELRVQAVRAVLGAADQRAERRRVAEQRGVHERTVRRWVNAYQAGVLAPKRTGPRPRPIPREERRGILAMLLTLGALATVRQIRDSFSDVPYRMIERMKRRFQAFTDRRRRRGEQRLAWRGAGRVWAMDFTWPKAKLPGQKRCLLVIRDLASGCRLACVPCKGERSAIVVETLERLFALHGAPLVLKFDNGPGFKARRTLDFLESRDVQALPSPTYRPQYNGSIERSLGWTKKRIEQLALQAGHPGHWTAEDIERAREQANLTLKPWGVRGPTPEKYFGRRGVITRKERERFKRTVRKRIQALLEMQTDELGRLITDTPYETTERRAITHALAKCGYLRIRRGC